jgi:hypothetical protein
MHHAGLILNHGARLHICSFMSMTSSGDRSVVTVGTRAVRDRDERVDFFRGVALIFIFIDHIPGNTFAKFTLSNFGFADAAEIFVLLAGYAAFLAYAKAFAEGWGVGLARIGLRIRDLYVAHLLVLIVCVAGLAVAGRTFQNPVYFEHVNLTPFNSDPAGAIGRALVLLYQPGYLNILPLYVLLLIWFPLLLWLMRTSVALALAVSAGLWAGSGYLQYNLPSYPDSYGWVFNPFAWQFLFSLGAVSAGWTGMHARSRSRSSWLLWIALGYVAFGILVAAPWTKLPNLGEARLLPDFRPEISKQYLSVWRLVHIAALGYVAASLASPRAVWLTRTWARLVINCGQHSLPVFCLSIILSMTGYVIFVEAGRGLLLHILVNAGGVALLGFTAWKLAHLKQARAQKSLARDAVKGPGWSPSRL